MRSHANRLLLIPLALSLLLACSAPAFDTSGGPILTPFVAATPTPTLDPLIFSPTAAVVPITPLPTATPKPSPTPFPTLPPLPTPTPFGCQRPTDAMNIVAVADGIVVNQRTWEMLSYAQTLYGGPHDLTRAITQGSYTTGEAASFGTHDGGGAVDLSVRDVNDWNHIYYEDFDAMILALRRAGFAAWVRDIGELYANSPIHIHAIAIGDPDLSPAARDQLTGPAGYFRGFNGLPVDPPVPDPYDIVLCPWMVEMGYFDLRGGG